VNRLNRRVFGVPFRRLGATVSDVDEGWALGIAWTVFLVLLAVLAYVVLRRRS
jgi:hypothetical protein